MGKSKIVKNISTYNFDYRVCRHFQKNKEGKRILMDGEPISYLHIHEIWFGAEGEIAAYIEEPERAFGDDLEGLKFELKEQMAALKKPILDFDFVIDQTRRSSRRSKRRLKQGKNPEGEWEETLKAAKDCREGTCETFPIEDMFRELGITPPVYSVEGEENSLDE
jgi:hypothetical protein